MKHNFDKLEAFRCALNALTKLWCNIPDAYDKDQAAEELHRLSKAWHRDEDYVIAAIFKTAQTVVDTRLRYIVQKATERLKLPITEEDFREQWNNLSDTKKLGLADGVIDLLVELKKEG